MVRLRLSGSSKIEFRVCCFSFCSSKIEFRVLTSVVVSKRESIAASKWRVVAPGAGAFPGCFKATTGYAPLWLKYSAADERCT